MKLSTDTTQEALWLSGGGEMGKLIREKDWSKTPFGPIETWPASLRTMLGVVLNSRFPMLIWWGPDLLHLYNDAYTPILREKHPASLGAPAAKIWAEVWDVAGPMARGVQNGGPATWTEDLQLFIKSGDMDEETYFTFSYSPIIGEDGKVAGLLNTVRETTNEVLNGRRLQILHDLAARAGDTKSEADAYQQCMEVLSERELDIPFALLYTINDDRTAAQLVGSAGVKKYKGKIKANKIPLAQKDPSQWPIKDALRDLDTVVVKDLDKRFGSLPLGSWQGRPTKALILPIMHAGWAVPETFLILGVSPHRKLDDRKRYFFRGVADQVGAAITSARAYESEKKRAEELAELDRLKTVFFTNISHEFRTPLTLMLGPLSESLADESLSKERLRQLELVRRSTYRLQRLVNNLLDFSSLEAGTMQSFFQPVELGSVTAELASSFHSAMDSGGLKFKIHCPPLKKKVYVDYAAWEKIVFNLISNALKYTLKGTVEVTLREKGKFVELEVRDTGHGIPSTELPHLFERFHRVRGIKSRSIEGSGIGLAMTNELVKLHGGKIIVKSSYGNGTSFIVIIPSGKAHLPKTQVVETEDDIVSTSQSTAMAYLDEARSWTTKQTSDDIEAIKKLRTVKSRANETILIVDDNADMREYIRRILDANTSLSVVTATNGKQALKMIAKQMPSLIITDIMMPEMDGFELVTTIRKDSKATQVPIIFLSARAGEKERVSGIAEGVDDYLVKPFSRDELVAHVLTRLNLTTLRNKGKSK